MLSDGHLQPVDLFSDLGYRFKLEFDPLETKDESVPDFLVICSGFVESQHKMIVIVKFLRDIEVLSLKA